ncbi:hypothetical protein FM042_00080 [Aliidiomarina halalkaliphila]|uniref:Photosynthesis system II assembly factor Ycf48/Hcf136-like domain-containing protein n=1 Tax=Aliidiomarina halalkaliphila TaxID=2593535 RepID=A0A552X2P5_9GAMM|nr:hypothetical protein [Aliidiomarina halalkaliphila]TRW49311.1 hypothetical protein FM042_00080 [Aliidiomarina halalkaliphila]
MKALMWNTLVVLGCLALPSAAAENHGLPEGHWSTVYAVNNDIIWVGNHDGQVAVSSNGGETWDISTPGGRTANLDIRQLKAFDDRHAFVLSTGRGERSRLLLTRNGGFSWRQMYRGNGDEELRCFALIPDGEGFVLGDTLDDNWHVVRSSNGNNWLASRSGFSERSLPSEAASASGSCAVFANNTFLMGTLNGTTARIMHKGRTSLRFQVLDTPLSAGQDAGVHAVYPLSQNDFLIAGGAAGSDARPELFRFTQGSFTQLPAPPLQGALTQMTAAGTVILAGNTSGFYRSADFGEQWQSVNDQGVVSISCFSDSSCWYLDNNRQLNKLNIEE